MCLNIEDAFDKSIEFVELLELHVDFLRRMEKAREKGSRNYSSKAVIKHFTDFMEFFFKLKSASTCCAHCRQKLCH